MLAGLAGTAPAHAQAPTLITQNPVRNATAVPLAAPVSLVFSQAIDPATAGNLRLFGAQYRGRRNVTVGSSGPTVALTPATPPSGVATAGFRPGEVLSLTIPATVRSTAGLAARAQVMQFTAAVGGPGRGTFALGTDLPMPYNYSQQALADVDSDGDLDLLVSQGSNYGTLARFVAVRLNNGQGTFSAAPDVSVGTTTAPNELVMADVDGDGDLDLLAACSTVVSVRLNNGQGGFSGGSDVSVLVNASSLAVGDLDADGDLDLLTYTQNNGQTVASIRLNQGNGTFAGGSELAVAGGSGALALGDVDNDGDLDLVTAGFTSGYIYTCFNLGSGTFGLPTTHLIGNNPAGVALADVDGDSDLDLVVGCARSNTVETRLNNGSGQYAATGTSVVVSDYPHDLCLTDFDSDGDLDLLVGHTYSGNVSVRLNTGGVFGGGSNVAMGTTYTSGLAVGDLDGDQDIDFVTGAPGAGTTFVVRIGFNQGPAAPAPTCSAADTTVTITPAGVASVSCDQLPVLLSGHPSQPASARYEWQYTATAGAPWQALATANGQPTYLATQAGRYRLRTTQGNCVATSAATEVRTAAALTYEVPNVFTPNHDHLNDAFELRLTAPRTFQLRVFNRWGREVFSTNHYGDFWTGAGAAAGVYYYYWRYSTDCDPVEHTLKGTVTLVQ